MARPQRLPIDRPMVERMLFPGKVLRLACDQPGRLVAREGELWITFDSAQPHGWTRDDHFLSGGQSMQLAVGDVVFLSAGDPRYGLASFDWQPVRQLVRTPAASPLLPRLQLLLQEVARRAGQRGPSLA